ncbi:DUF2017 family protein, partial [Rothia mucilaginosa]|uniref:DUF2017 family protein n=1 Tax=Rothia mucilaginosa TaxID=43675 RepID=UPI0026E9AD49
MARPFRRTPGGYTARFEQPERELIRELAEDVRALLRPADTTADGGTVDPLEALVGITENPTIPEDSAVARLLPVAEVRLRFDPLLQTRGARVVLDGARLRPSAGRHGLVLV